MSAATVTTKLEKVALARHKLTLDRPKLVRKVQQLLRDSNGNEAKVELVIRWIMARDQEDFDPTRLSYDKFYAVAHGIDCPAETAWADRLWEYELALEDDPATERLCSTLTYWLDYWTDAALVYDDEGVAKARDQLRLLRENHLAR